MMRWGVGVGRKRRTRMFVLKMHLVNTRYDIVFLEKIMFIHQRKCNELQCLPLAQVLSPYPIHPTLFSLERSRVLSHRGSEHPHILIKVAVLSLEIRGCIFKLSITPRLSGLREPVIQIRRCNLLRMAIPLHCTLVSVSRTMKKFMTQRKIYIYAERVIHDWSHT